MTPRKPLDPDRITVEEAAALLGLSRRQVSRLRREGLLGRLPGLPSCSLADVEQYIVEPWLTGQQAAEVLGVSHNRVSQLANVDRIPYVVSPTGRRWYRQQQLMTVANARAARREGFQIG